jgi:hypothetical protein
VDGKMERDGDAEGEQDRKTCGTGEWRREEKGDERERTSNWKCQSDFTSNMSMLIMTEKQQHTRIDVPSSNPRQYSYRVSYDRFRQARTSCKHNPPVAICSHDSMSNVKPTFTLR